MAAATRVLHPVKIQPFLFKPWCHAISVVFTNAVQFRATNTFSDICTISCTTYHTGTCTRMQATTHQTEPKKPNVHIRTAKETRPKSTIMHNSISGKSTPFLQQAVRFQSSFPPLQPRGIPHIQLLMHRPMRSKPLCCG